MRVPALVNGGGQMHRIRYMLRRRRRMLLNGIHDPFVRVVN